MKHCPTCQSQFEDDAAYCPHDGTELIDASSEQRDDLAGATLGDTVRLVSLVFSDHVGERYLGHLVSDDTPVRVTVFHRNFAAENVDRARRFADRLDQPLPDELLDVHSVRLDADPPFIVEERPGGRPLADELNSDTIDWRRAVCIALRLGRVLEWLIERQLPHRCVHPRSLYIDDADRIQLAELPVGLLTFPLPSLDENTPAEAIPVYPGHIAPERILSNDDVVESTAAVYTIGAVLAEMLGAPLFDKSDLQQTTFRDWLENERKTPPEFSITDDAPGSLGQLLEMTLAPGTKKRFDAPSAAISALSSVLDDDLDDTAPPVEAAEKSVFDDDQATGPVPVADDDVDDDTDSKRSAKSTKLGLPAQSVDDDDAAEEAPESDADDETAFEPLDEPDNPDEQRSSGKQTALMGAVSVQEMDADGLTESAEEAADEEASSNTGKLTDEQHSSQGTVQHYSLTDGDDEPTDDSSDDDVTEDSSSSIVVDPELSRGDGDDDDEPADSDAVDADDSEELSVGYVEAAQTTDPGADDWFSRSKEEAWQEDFVRESKTRSQKLEKAIPYAMAAGVILVVIGAFVVFQGVYADDAPEDLEEQVAEDEAELDEFARERLEEQFELGMEQNQLFGPDDESAIGALDRMAEHLDDEAFDYYRERFVEVAQEKFEEAIEQDSLLRPRSRSAHDYLTGIESYGDDIAYERARRKFVRAADERSQYYEEQGQLRAARSLAGHASDAAPGDDELRERHDRLYDEIQQQLAEDHEEEEQEDDEEEDEDLEPTGSAPTGSDDGDSGPSLRQLLDEGRQAKSQRDNETARDRFEAVLEINPDHPTANGELGDLAFNRGDHQTAITHLERAVAGAPDQNDYRLILGRAHYRIGNPEQAITIWEEVLEREPDHPRAESFINVAERDLN